MVDISQRVKYKHRDVCRHFEVFNVGSSLYLVRSHRLRQKRSSSVLELVATVVAGSRIFEY